MPQAMAPPFTLTLAGSQPMSLIHRIAWAAKASLISISPGLFAVQPAFARHACSAGTGPMPMIVGSTPAEA